MYWKWIVPNGVDIIADGTRTLNNTLVIDLVVAININTGGYIKLQIDKEFLGNVDKFLILGDANRYLAVWNNNDGYRFSIPDSKVSDGYYYHGVVNLK